MVAYSLFGIVLYISLFPAQHAARALKEIVIKGAVLNNANNV